MKASTAAIYGTHFVMENVERQPETLLRIIFEWFGNFLNALKEILGNLIKILDFLLFPIRLRSPASNDQIPFIKSPPRAQDKIIL